MTKKRILSKANYYSRLLHKASAITTSILGGVMTITGLALKFPQVFKLPFLSPSFVRFLHNALSPFFAAALGVMILTGLFMYVFPWILKKLN